jgi:hypothetical protein
MILRGVIDASGAAYPSSPTAGDFYRISVAGTISGTVYAANDMAYYDGSSWRKIANEITAAANTFTDKQTYAASTTSAASINIPHGTAPTSPSNGDVWTTTSGLLARINGTTQTAAFLSANTFTGKQTFVASDTSNASVNLPPGTAPTSPSNGDMWITSSSIYARVAGSTLDLGSGSVPVGTLVPYYDLLPANIPSGYAFKGYGLVSSQDFFFPYILGEQSNIVVGDDGYAYRFFVQGYRARYNFSTDVWDMPSGQSSKYASPMSQTSNSVNEPKQALRFSGGNYFIIHRNAAYTIDESTYAATLAVDWPAITYQGAVSRFCMLTDDLVLMANTTTTKTYNPSTGAIATVTNLSAACEVCDLSDGGAIALTTTTGTKRWDAGRTAWTATGNHPFGVTAGVAMCRLPTTGYIFGITGSTCAIYDTGTDTWTTKTAPPGSVGIVSSVAVSGNNVIVAVGGLTVTTTYIYSISGNSWTTSTTKQPAMSPSSITRYMSGGGYVFAIQSSTSSGCVAFTTNTAMSDWQGHGFPTSVTLPSSANGVYIGNNKFMFGVTTTWYTYNVSTGVFTTLAAPPAGVSSIDMIWDGSNYVYGFASGGNGILYRYSISGDSWSTMATALDPSTNRGVYLTSDKFICFNSSADQPYAIYDVSSNSYTNWRVWDDIGNSLVAYPVSGVGVVAFGVNPDGMLIDTSFNCYRVDQQIGPASGLGTSTMTTSNTATSLVSQIINSKVHYFVISSPRVDRQRIFNLRLLMEKQ